MAAKALIDAYKRAQLEVIKRITRRATYGTVSEYERQLLAEIDGILRSLGVDTAKWIREAVPAAYQSAATDVYRQLSMTPTAGASFAGINQAAVKVIIDNATGRASDALQAIGRRLNDQVRDAALRAAELKLTSNQTIRAMQRELQKELVDQGNAMGIPDSRGRIQPVDAYANMTARTVTREATNTATMNTAHELGSHLFKMSSHFPTCKICAPRQGRVYRDIDFPEGDERNRFPHISQAFPGWPEFRTVHPNCRHVVSAVGWSALSREKQKRYLVDADKPFDADPRSEKEIKAYDLGQAENRMMREDRKQWERMRARLGDDAPKTFGAFRRVKYADGGVRRAFYETDENGHEVLRCGRAGNSAKWQELTTANRNWLYKQDFRDIMDMQGKMPDQTARRWYNAHDAAIPDMIDKTQPLEEQARQAFNLRNQYRTEARLLMADREKAAALDTSDPNMTFEQLVERKHIKYGLTGDDAYRDILRSATTTRRSVNKELGLEE